MRLLKQIALSTVVCAATALSLITPAKAASDLPNLMIMGEDLDQDTVPRSSRVFKRVLNAVSEQLNLDGFDVYDETAVSLGEFAQGRSRRADDELIDIAKSISRPPIDVVVLVSIYASAEHLDYTTKVRTRVVGRLLDVRSGRRMGNFEISAPRNFRAPVDCNRECILETVGDNAKLLGREVGDVLVQKLADEVDYGSNQNNSSTNVSTRDDQDNAGRGNANGCGGMARDYYLVFDNFSEQELLDMEDVILAKFSCYISHRPTGTQGKRHEYTYKFRTTDNRMKRNLVRAMEYLGLQGQVRQSANEFVMSKQTKRRDRYFESSNKW